MLTFVMQVWFRLVTARWAHAFAPPQVPGILMWTVRQWALVETDAVSIERLVEYAELPSEEQVIVPPQHWQSADRAEPKPDSGSSSAAANGHDVSSRGTASELVIEGLRLRYSSVESAGKIAASAAIPVSIDTDIVKHDNGTPVDAVVVPVKLVTSPLSSEPPLVLKDLYLRVPAGCKLAVVSIIMRPSLDRLLRTLLSLCVHVVFRSDEPEPASHPLSRRCCACTAMKRAVSPWATKI